MLKVVAKTIPRCDFTQIVCLMWDVSISCNTLKPIAYSKM
jgi:hypothetical protein